jgi:hypothetical protein
VNKRNATKSRTHVTTIADDGDVNCGAAAASNGSVRRMWADRGERNESRTLT